MHIHYRNLENPLEYEEGNENPLLISVPTANDCLIFWCLFLHKDIPNVGGPLRQPCFLPLSRTQHLVTTPQRKSTFTKYKRKIKFC